MNDHLLKKHEGFRATPYKCTAGKMTIGYGLNLEEGITEEEAEYLLLGRIKKVEEKLSSYPWFVMQSKNRRTVLINMAYNLGINGLFKFKKMIAELNRYDYVCAAKEMMDSRWARQVGSRADELHELMLRG